MACTQLASRLDEVLTLHTLHDQLAQQLSPDEQVGFLSCSANALAVWHSAPPQKELDFESAFSVFRDINPLLQNAYSNGLWEVCSIIS